MDALENQTNEITLSPVRHAVLMMVAGLLGYGIAGVIVSPIVQVEQAAIPYAGFLMGALGGAALGLAKRSLRATLVFAFASAATMFLGLLAGRLVSIGSWFAFGLAGLLTGAVLAALNSRTVRTAAWGALVGMVGFVVGTSVYYDYLRPASFSPWMLLSIAGALGGFFIGAVLGQETDPKF